MNKTTTFFKTTNKSSKLLKQANSAMQPSDKVLKTILQFSSVYTVQQTSTGQYIETILN